MSVGAVELQTQAAIRCISDLSESFVASSDPLTQESAWVPRSAQPCMVSRPECSLCRQYTEQCDQQKRTPCVAMNRRRGSDPPRVDSLYPTSPTATHDRSTRASSIFPYSTARPSTNYSEQSWVPTKDAPPVPEKGPQPPESPFGSALDDGGDETPLYARSDWDQERSPATESSAYSRSSFAGMTTAPPAIGHRMNTLGDIKEEDEDDAVSVPAGGSGAGGLWGRGNVVMSPGMMTPLSPQGVFGDQHMVMSPGMMTGTPRASGFGLGYVDSPGEMTPAIQAQGGKGNSRKSTLPSVLELEHLTGRTAQNPFANGQTQRRPYEPQTPSHTIGGSASSSSPRIGQSPTLLSPAAQQRLGRMSVATARYTAGKKRVASGLMDDKGTEGGNLDLTALPLKGATGMTRFYLTWRIFIAPAPCLTAALLITISLQNNSGPVSRYVTVRSGIFTKSPNGVRDVGLGVNGWCPLERWGRPALTFLQWLKTAPNARLTKTATLPTRMARTPSRESECQQWASKQAHLRSALLSSLGNFLTALCVLVWLLAMYTVVTAFLHFHLFFALSLPFTHLMDEALIPAPNGGKGKSQAQIEVDIRVRTERPPYEGYHWVWWAWWGHRRAPLGHAYAVLTSVLSISTASGAVLSCLSALWVADSSWQWRCFLRIRWRKLLLAKASA